MLEKNVELSCLLDNYGSFLTNKQQNLLNLHVNEDLSLAEIANIEGVSRQGVFDALKRAEQQLYDMEAKLRLVSRKREAEQCIAELRECLKYADIDPHSEQSAAALIDKLETIWEDNDGV